MTAEERHAEETQACRVCAQRSTPPKHFTVSEWQLLDHLRDEDSRPFVHGYLLHLLGADQVARVVAAVHARQRAADLAEQARRQAGEQHQADTVQGSDRPGDQQ